MPTSQTNSIGIPKGLAIEELAGRVAARLDEREGLARDEHQRQTPEQELRPDGDHQRGQSDRW